MRDQRPALRLMLIAIAIVANSHAQQPSPPTLDDLRSQKFAMWSLDGKRVDLNKLLGKGKPVVLDFWATWCGPCRQEIPHLKALAEKHRRDGLIVIGLNLEDYEADRRKVKDFVKEFEMSYQVAFAPAQIYQFFNGQTVSYRIPQTYVFGADGKLIRRLIGYNPHAGKQVLESAVEHAIATIRYGEPK